METLGDGLNVLSIMKWTWTRVKCYDLEMKYSLKMNVMKLWFPMQQCREVQICPHWSWGHWPHQWITLLRNSQLYDYWDLVELIGDRTYLEGVDPWGCVLGSCIMSLHPSSLSASLLPWDKQFSSTIPLLPWCFVSLQAQSNGATWPWAETSKIMSQSKSFLFTLFLSGFWKSDEKLI